MAAASLQEWSPCDACETQFRTEAMTSRIAELAAIDPPIA
jgi:hypothetical protein